MRTHVMTYKLLPLVWLWPALLPGQTNADLKQVLERLDRLERQNQLLLEEVRALRAQVGATRTPAPAEETLAIQARRTEELAQVKVEAANRFPLRVTGMALFNARWNSAGASYGGAYSESPVTAPVSGYATAGATLRQSIIGLEFQGPRTVWGGKVRGSLNMDFYAGSGSSLDSVFRLRTGSLEVDWKDRSILVGQEKPIIAPRDPSSLAQVGVSPLTGAGNLWLWQPQVRFEQRLALGEQTGLRAQVGVYQTSEASAALPASYQSSLESARPALQGRFELWHGFGGGRRIEIAPGFHTSSTHVAQTSVPSSLFSLDWFANPWTRLEFTGAFFSGQNLANLGTGLRQGFTILGRGSAIPVHARGGWAQAALSATPRLTFHFFTGQHDDRNADLRPGGIAKNQAYGANFFYRLAPNVLAGLEASQTRTTYLGSGNRLNRHYDVALAYLF
jgi:hypothetical protein